MTVNSASVGRRGRQSKHTLKVHGGCNGINKTNDVLYVNIAISSATDERLRADHPCTRLKKERESQSSFDEQSERWKTENSPPWTLV